MAILQQIITLTQEQYIELISNQTLTLANGQTYTYNENALYVVPETGSGMKSGTPDYWTQNNSYVPAAGEIILYLPDANHNYSSIKIGDGTTNISNLSFINAGSADKVNHTLTFGNGTYVYDGSANVTVPVYTGTII